MGWFDDQIEFRKKHERELLSDSFESIARSVTGRKIHHTLADQEDVSDAVSAPPTTRSQSTSGATTRMSTASP